MDKKDVSKKEDEKTEPLEVKIVPQKPEKTPYTPTDNENYEDINITEDEISEFVEG